MVALRSPLQAFLLYGALPRQADTICIGRPLQEVRCCLVIPRRIEASSSMIHYVDLNNIEIGCINQSIYC